ncbi:MAG: hypothetical protein ABJA34_12950 [Pseudonocardiales bacterium]
MSFEPGSVDAVGRKLQDLYEALPEHEKLVLETLLTQAGRATVGQETAAEHSIIIVGGRSAPELVIELNPGVLVSLNPQPIPPGRQITD